jgi:hypothetical protein
MASFLEGCVIAVLLIFSRDRSWRSSQGFNVAAAVLLLLRNSPEKMDDASESTSILPSTPNTGATIQPPHNDDSVHPIHLELDGISDAHKQWRIALFTTISVAVVFVKLCAMKGIPAFTSAMMGLLIG